MAGYAASSFTVVGTYQTGRGVVAEKTRSLYTSSNSTADDNGEWMDTFGWQSFVVYVDVTSTQTINLQGSNAATIPANSSQGLALATALTADGYFKIEEYNIPRFVKVYLSDTSGGSSVVDLKVKTFIGNTI